MSDLKEKIAIKLTALYENKVYNFYANEYADEIISLCNQSKDENGKDLLKRAKEYAEFYEATKNFNTLGFFNDLIVYLEPPKQEKE